MTDFESRLQHKEEEIRLARLENGELRAKQDLDGAKIKHLEARAKSLEEALVTGRNPYWTGVSAPGEDLGGIGAGGIGAGMLGVGMGLTSPSAALSPRGNLAGSAGMTTQKALVEQRVLSEQYAPRTSIGTGWQSNLHEANKASNGDRQQALFSAGVGSSFKRPIPPTSAADNYMPLVSVCLCLLCQ